jgi:hypothetical protein
MLVLHDPTWLRAVLMAWRRVGVIQVTQVASETSGLASPAGHTLFAAVGSQATVCQCLAAMDRLRDEHDEPGIGMFTAWPLAMAELR